ncbi:hypothetical protein JHK85_021591 [Glycine max]|nr:hypothetical protein JHK85_021591 [Glycine max]
MFHAMVLKSKAVFLVLLVLVVCQLSCGLGEDWSTRRLSRHNNNNKVIPPSCGELVLKSQCSENSKCRWCTSEDLDDMCFSKSEALRLPHQSMIYFKLKPWLGYIVEGREEMATFYPFALSVAKCHSNS